MNARVLLVDDEPNVLAGYKRQLRKDFNMDTAGGGQEALDKLDPAKPYAIVVSDMRMPGMDGVQLLAEVRRRAPETVRMMLTGNADLQTCITAVNEGNIFRFLTKPCQNEDLAKALNDGIDQYALVTAERELVEGTLRGCVRTLTDVLGVINPAAFSRGARVRRYVRHISAELNVRHFWEYEMAAALSLIGLVALPAEILARIQGHRTISTEQMALLKKYPEYGCQLLAEIPRFEMVAQIVGRQGTRNQDKVLPADVKDDEMAVVLGAQILRVALDLDDLMQTRRPFIEALSELHAKYGPDHPLVEALMSFESQKDDVVVMEITADELSANMCAAEDICSTAGHAILSKGQPITDAVRMHLRSCAAVGGLQQPFKVEVISENR